MSIISSPFHKSFGSLSLLKSPSLFPHFQPRFFPWYPASPSQPLNMLFFLIEYLSTTSSSQSQPLSRIIPLVMDYTHLNFPLLLIPPTCFSPLWLHSIEAKTAKLFHHQYLVLSLSLSPMLLPWLSCTAAFPHAEPWDGTPTTYLVPINMFLLFSLSLLSQNTLFF